MPLNTLGEVGIDMKSKPTKHYVYKITCNYPNKCFGFIYFGRSQSMTPKDNPYMGSGTLLKYYQKRFGMEYFSKEVIRIFAKIEDAIHLESKIVNERFIGRADNFNVGLGGVRGSTVQAHPIKQRILQYLVDQVEAKKRKQKTWEYRRDMEIAMTDLYLNNVIGADIWD